MIEYLVCVSLAVYVVTVVLVKGHLFTFFRCWFRFKTLWLIKGRPNSLIHPIDCRLCTGAWVSLIASIVVGIPLLGILKGLMLWLPIYGISYFLATQER